MPRWCLSLPLPAARTLPSRLHHSSSPIAVDSPSHYPLMSSCSHAVHRHPSPSITVHRHAVHHRQVTITPSLSVHHHCNCSPLPLRSCCPSPCIAIKEPLHHPLPSRSRRRCSSPSRSRPSLSIRLLLSSHRRFVHCCPSLLSCRHAVDCCRTAPSITVKSPSRHPLPSIAVAITLHQHCARAIPRRPLPSISHRTFHHCQVPNGPSIAVHPCPFPL